MLTNPEAAAPCKLCSCTPDGIRAQPVILAGMETSRCAAKHLPEQAIDLAEAVLVFKKTGHLPLSGGWWEQPAAFVQACQVLGWEEATNG